MSGGDDIRWHIGTIGFSYDDWRNAFYPKSLKPGEFLGFYARHFDIVEIDSTFHAAPPPERFERWAAAVPAGFRFAVKTPRAITHEGVVSDAAGPMRRFVDDASRLGKKLHAIVIQYPPTLPARVWPQVERFLGGLPGGVRYAVEFRHGSWNGRDDVHAGLERLGVCLVNAEYDLDPRPPVVITDFAYVRLIGVHGRYDPLNYERVDRTDRLRWWRDALANHSTRRPAEACCLIGDDYAGFAVATADRMRRLVGQSVSTPQERLGTLF